MPGATAALARRGRIRKSRRNITISHARKRHCPSKGELASEAVPGLPCVRRVAPFGSGPGHEQIRDNEAEQGCEPSLAQAQTTPEPDCESDAAHHEEQGAGGAAS